MAINVIANVPFKLTSPYEVNSYPLIEIYLMAFALKRL
jgi:hypothetical protein